MNPLAALVLAFTLVGNEQSYGPYARPGDGDEHAIATAKSGALLAWSERANGNTQIHLALLNESARLISPITVLPLLQPGVAIGPAVASNGTTFMLAYFERAERSQQLVTIEVDAAGLPIGTPQPVGKPTIPETDPRVALDWDGSAYRIIPAPGAIAGGAIAHAVVKGVYVPNDPPCGGGPFGCCCRYTTAVVWTAGTRSGQHVLGNYP